MPRPRRPILAAVCAVLLAAVVALWARGIWTVDSVEWDNEEIGFGFVIGGGIGGGAASLYVIDNGPRNSDPRGWTYYSQDADATRWDDEDLPRWWFHGRWLGKNVILTVPMWAISLVACSGLWWCWRGRKAKVGFPMEAKAEHGTSERISN